MDTKYSYVRKEERVEASVTFGHNKDAVTVYLDYPLEMELNEIHQVFKNKVEKELSAERVSGAQRLEGFYLTPKGN
jgi:hypothetical protein